MSLDNNSKDKLISKIIMDTHVIEKGLSMPERHLGFAIPRLVVLLENIIFYIERYGISDCHINHGYSVVQEYIELHEKNDVAVDKSVLSLFSRFDSLMPDNNIKANNTEDITKQGYFSKINAPFFEFSDSRSSVRNFSDEQVDHDLMLSVLDHCRNAPSACNRQAVRVHLYEKPLDIQKILDLQGGSRGFSHLAKFLIVVTFESSKYFEQQERNLGYVDGGMYAMNLLYTLHAKELGACILNASHDPAKDRKMHRVTNVPDSEVFVAMIAGGKVAESLNIAQSYRYPLSNSLTVAP